jgi:hypothetical protein
MKIKNIIVLFLFCINANKNVFCQNSNMIFGDWSLCKITNGLESTVFNICPTITFRKALTGIYRTALDTSEFKYYLDSSNCEIKFTETDTTKFFSMYNVFRYSVCYSDTGTTLVLRTEKNTEFIFRR